LERPGVSICALLGMSIKLLYGSVHVDHHKDLAGIYYISKASVNLQVYIPRVLDIQFLLHPEIVA
jgi:hypothetical protein